MGRVAKVSVAATTLSTAAYAEPVTIAALGDSLVAGYGVETEDGLVPQLENWLRDSGADVVVVNAGVSGDTSAGGLARTDWTLTPDVDALIVALGGNDFLRGLDPQMTRDNITQIVTKAEAAGVPVLLVGLVVSTNYGEDYKTNFDALYPEIATQLDVPYYPTFFGALLALGDTAETRATYMQPDGLHPNAEGVKVIVQDFGPVVLSFIQGLAP